MPRAASASSQAAVEALGGDRHPRQQCGPGARPRSVRRLHRGGRGDRARDERAGLMRMTRLVPAAHPRRRPHRQHGLDRGPAGLPERLLYIASKFAVRGYTYALREDLLGRPIRITTVDAGLVETEFSVVRFRGDEEAARPSTPACEPVHARRGRRLRPLRADAAAAREHRRDRRQGARAVERRPHRPRGLTSRGDDDPRGLDLLHLRRDRRPRRPDERLLRRGHALPLAASSSRVNGARPLLLSSGKVEYFSAAFYLRNPVAGRARAGLALDRARALRRRRHAGAARGPERDRGAALASSSRSSVGTDFADIIAVKEHDFALGDPLHARPLPPPAAVRDDGARPARPRGASDGRATTQVLLSRAGRDRRLAASASRVELGPRERWELRVDVVASLDGERVAAARASSAASATSARTCSDSLAAWQPAGAAAPRALGRRSQRSFDAVGRRPRLAAHAGATDGIGMLPAAGHAVVHDRLRARHADHVPADAPLRPRARDGRARGARRAPGDARTTRRSTPSRARSSTSCAAARPRDAGSAPTTARSTRRRSSCPALGGLALDAATPARPAAARAGAARARAGSTTTATATATASSSTSGARRAGSRTSRGRTPATRSASATAALARTPIAPVEVQGYVYDAKLRMRRARARGLARPRARRPARGARRPSCGAASTRRSGSSDAAATTRSRSTATSGRSTRSARTSATCSGAGSSRRSASTTIAAPPDGRASSGRAGASARCRPATPPTTRSATTTAPSGPTTRPSSPGASRASGHGRRRRPDRRGAARGRGATSTTRCPRSSPASVAHETPFPIAYPTAARPQAWAAGTPVLLLQLLLGLEPDPAQTCSSRAAGRCPSWLERLGSTGVRALGRVMGRATSRTARQRGDVRDMRVAVLSPVWFPVPPPGYGGIEWVVSLLADGLVDAGHDVTLFASGDSRTQAKLAAVFEDGAERADRPDVLGAPARARLLRAARTSSTSIHDHTGLLGLDARSACCRHPLVHTVHGPLDGEPGDLRAGRADRARTRTCLALAEPARAAARICPGSRTCPNALDLSVYPCQAAAGRYLLFLGRMSPDKGATGRSTVAIEPGCR